MRGSFPRINDLTPSAILQPPRLVWSFFLPIQRTWSIRRKILILGAGLLFASGAGRQIDAAGSHEYEMLSQSQHPRTLTNALLATAKFAVQMAAQVKIKIFDKVASWNVRKPTGAKARSACRPGTGRGVAGSHAGSCKLVQG